MASRTSKSLQKRREKALQKVKKDLSKGKATKAVAKSLSGKKCSIKPLKNVRNPSDSFRACTRKATEIRMWAGQRVILCKPHVEEFDEVMTKALLNSWED